MLIHDDIFDWEGFGGKLRIGAGKCRLRIFDLQQNDQKGLAHLKPYIVIVSDVPESRMSVKSCISHIATSVARAFGLDPQRILFVEYYSEVHYGQEGENYIPERYDAVDFEWHGQKALHPRWRDLKPPLIDTIKELMRNTV